MVVSRKVLRNSGVFGGAGPGGLLLFQFIALAGTVLKPEEGEIVGTESIHQEFLKKFSIQAL